MTENITPRRYPNGPRRYPDATPAAFAEPVEYELELGSVEPAGFLPLVVRRALYLAGLAGAVAAPIVAVTSPEYATAILSAAGVLEVAALGVALGNPSR